MNNNRGEVPLHIGYYLAGFVDGEGSFNISFRFRDDYRNGIKISACFNVSNKDIVILRYFNKYLGCGTLRSRPDDVWYYEVNKLQDILEKVVPFFKKFPFLSAKKKNDFIKFVQILDILQEDNPRSLSNVRKIIALRNLMNGGGKRKFTDEQIIARVQAAEIKESSETIRQTQCKTSLR